VTLLRSVLFAVVFAALGAAACPRARAEGNFTFQRTILRTGGKVTRRVIYDVDRDGLGDVLLFRGRTVLLFKQKTRKGFSRWPDQVLRVWRNAVMCDLMHLRKGGGTALVCAAEGAVAFHPFRGGRFLREVTPLLRAPTALGYPGEEDLLCRRFAFDVDGDGRDDLVLPAEGAFAVHWQDEKGGFDAAWRFATAPAVSVRGGRPGLLGELTVTARFPMPYVGDFNGDGKKDLILRRKSSLDVFLQKGPRRFSPSADVRLDTRLPGKEEKKTGRFALRFQTPVLVEDLDGDGVVDVVKPQPLEGRTLVFLRKGGGARLSDPALVARTDGWPLGALTEDLNRDGLPDLVIGHIDKIGVLGALRIFLTGTVKVHSAYFLNRRGFGKEPDGRLSLSVPLRFATTSRGFRMGTTALVNFQGDFNGDGLRDLLVKTGVMRLEIFRGTPGRVFEARAWRAVEIPDTENAMWVFPDVADLNADGISDILLHYRDWRENLDDVVLLLSEKGK
jgi:hypothetical protein